ncbi:MAG: KEOPS complex subunit Pcc1 [Sulfolobaceae archaeon]|uniref:KEOPS complex subunit Pcc1 n=1 Tax=Stygiolobus sp. RP850M TaxID=3133137 RepID=UPI0028CCC469|nr:KEOPS complex subunit Pcc1 [Sulfolobaceae archaeon]
MKISITLRIRTSQPNNVAKIVNVDNINIPRGMEIKVEPTDDDLIVIVSMNIEKPRDILTLKNTADEIIQQINLVEKTLNKVR